MFIGSRSSCLPIEIQYFFNCVILLALLKMLGENANDLGFAQSYPQS